MRTLLCLLALAAVLPAQEEGEGAGKPAVIPQAERSKLIALLPNAAAFGGKATGAPQLYSTDLYRYIDGGADVFLSYRLAAMVHQQYKAGDTELTVDIYDHAAPLNAFGIYSAERSPDYHFIGLGAEGYESDEILNFLQGNYYVKLSAFSEKGKPQALLEGAARAISAKITGGRVVPQPAPWLPAAGMVARSQKYVLQSPLGHESLGPAATAIYKLDGQETTVLVSFAANATDAATRLATLKQSFAAKPLAGMPGEMWQGANKVEGSAVLFTRGRYLLMVLHPPAQPQGFLKELFSSIKE